LRNIDPLILLEPAWGANPDLRIESRESRHVSKVQAQSFTPGKKAYEVEEKIPVVPSIVRPLRGNVC
jgi:hypothetical protein